MTVSAIILAKTDSKALFEMTSECIRTLLDSESDVKFEVIVIESNQQFREHGFGYPDFVKVIVPNETFNFHRFLNLGIKQATGDFIALCNKDLIFHKHWFGEILKVSQAHTDIFSFSPSEDFSPNDKDFHIGYKVTQQLKGWCIVVKNEIFKKTGLLDETFSFYFADNDYAMTLKYYNLKHAIVYQSHVQHLEKKSTKAAEANPELKAALIKKHQVPRYLLEDRYNYIFNKESNLTDFLKFHNKWGSPKVLHRKNKIADLLLKYHLGFLNRLFLKIKF
jgi:glycosyltransferase involved in cell wall biosynthesis